MEIPVPSDFGWGEVLVIDGYMKDDVITLPLITLFAKNFPTHSDPNGEQEIFTVMIEPSFSNVYMRSELAVSKKTIF